MWERHITLQSGGPNVLPEADREDVHMLNARELGRIGMLARLYSHILAYCFALHFLLGTFLVVNSLELSFFYYFPRTLRLGIVNPEIDLGVWALAAASTLVLTIWPLKDRLRSAVQAGIAMVAVPFFPLLLSCPSGSFLQEVSTWVLFVVVTVGFGFFAYCSKGVLQESTGNFVSRVLVYGLGVLLAVEVSSGVYRILQSFDPMTSIGKIDASIELQLSYSLCGLLPWLYLGFLFSWAWVPIVFRGIARISIFRRYINTRSTSREQMPTERLGHNRLSVLLDPRVLVMLATAIFVGYYPYFQNPPWLVGTDAYWRYYDPLLRINAEGLWGGLSQALREWHPVSSILLYAGQLALGTTPFEIVRLTPMILVVILAFATWWFVARGKTTDFGLIVALFSALSVVTAVGMYSSIIANWMALVAWMLFFAYLAFRCDERIGGLDVAVLLLLSILILFIHPWTWGVFATSILLFALVTLYQERRRALKITAVLVLVVVVDALLALVSVMVLGGGQGSSVAYTLRLYTMTIGNPGSVLVFWDALNRLTQVWAAFFSPISIIVSILGVFYLQTATLAPWRKRLILCWLFASAIGSILVAPISYDPSQPTRSESQLWRMLFLTPFQLTLPLGAVMITGYLKRPKRANEGAMTGGIARSIRGVFLAMVFAIGFILAWTPSEWRLVPMLLVLPVLTGLCLVKSGGQERAFLSDIVLVALILVAFNYTTRSLAQLLIDPHNYTP